MEPSPKFDCHDLLTAPARALSAKRITLMTFFLCLGLLIYDAFTYLALAVDGQAIDTFWNVYGLLPVTLMQFSSTLPEVVYGLGIALALIGLMMGFFGVAAIEIEQVRGNRFLSLGSAIRFSFQRLGQLLVSEISIAAFIALIVILMLLLGLITRLPVVGDWVYVLSFVLPSFIIAMFTVFIVFVWAISIVLLPVAAAAERNGEAFSAILETFSTVIRQPIRWLAYTAYGLVAAKLFSFVYAYFCYRAVQFVVWAVSITGGEKAELLVRSGLSHMPVRSDLVEETLNIFPGLDWSFSIARWAHGGIESTAGHVMALMLFLVFASVIGYFLAVIATAQARGYVAIRYIKDDYRISDEKPMFFDEEHVNEPQEPDHDYTA